jgi:hypothetical protein
MTKDGSGSQDLVAVSSGGGSAAAECFDLPDGLQETRTAVVVRYPPAAAKRLATCCCSTSVGKHTRSGGEASR